MDVSVVICTYNRCQSLRDTLDSLMVQEEVSWMTWEILVVDNYSEDETAQAVKDYQSRNGHLVRYVFERNQGVAYARNTGVRHAKGGIVAFLDDDVLASPHWLGSLWRCFQETGADAVGGQIERKWIGQMPEWYSEELGGCLIHQEFGPNRVRWTSERKHMVTANMAFRHNVFERFGYFREELGRRGAQLVGGEDRELYRRLIQQGGVVIYEPAARVWHKVEVSRLDQKYFRDWFAGAGKTLGHEIKPAWHHRLTMVPVWVWKDLLVSFFRNLGTRLFPANQRQRFASEIWLRFNHGIFSEALVHSVSLRKNSNRCVFLRRRKR